MKKVLYLVDLQNDFFEGGALPVPNSNEVIPYICNLLENEALKKYDMIVFSYDNHPEKHISFASTHKVDPFTKVDGILTFPDHCIPGTLGMSFVRDVENFITKNIAKLFFIAKGTDLYLEEFSPSKDILLRFFRISLLEDGYKWNPEDIQVTVMGLATDYCVKETALTLKSLDMDVIVDLKGCRGVTSEGTKVAIEEMKKVDIKIINE